MNTKIKQTDNGLSDNSWIVISLILLMLFFMAWVYILNAYPHVNETSLRF